MFLDYIKLFLCSVFLGGEGMFLKGTRSGRINGVVDGQTASYVLFETTYIRTMGNVLFHTNSWYFGCHVFVVLDLFFSECIRSTAFSHVPNY